MRHLEYENKQLIPVTEDKKKPCEKTKPCEKCGKKYYLKIEPTK